jgi:hypothetical protein
MVGVTIGINTIHEVLAKLSAYCFSEMTGLEVIILGEKELQKSGLSHPASLKLKAFDFVNDDNILYFDADWFCTQNWNPKIFENMKSITACNDFVLNIDWPNQYHKYDFVKFNDYHLDNLAFHPITESRSDYINEIRTFSKILLEYGKWINTGFWIANREYHKDWLDKSMEYYTNSIGHHLEYYEQPAMNLAIEELGIKVNYLNRNYNTLVATREKWPPYLVGLHVKVKHNKKFLSKVLSGEIKTTKQVQDFFYDK